MEWKSKRPTATSCSTSRGRHRPHHHQPARGAQRVPPDDAFELSDAFNAAREDPEIGVIIPTGTGDQAFCSGGDQRIRGEAGYAATTACRGSTCSTCAAADPHAAEAGDRDGRGLRDRRRPRAARGCGIWTIAARTRFGQTGPKVGSFDGGFWREPPGAHHRSARRVIWYLCRQYDVVQALDMGS